MSVGRQAVGRDGGWCPSGIRQPETAIDRAGVTPDFDVASATGPSAKDAQLERATDVLKIARVIETHAADTQARGATSAQP